jgi:hypothetical protein
MNKNRTISGYANAAEWCENRLPDGFDAPRRRCSRVRRRESGGEACAAGWRNEIIEAPVPAMYQEYIKSILLKILRPAGTS